LTRNMGRAIAAARGSATVSTAAILGNGIHHW
jgi:hypothetical protein